MEQKQIQADFSRIVGAVKPMHSVNNGPALSRSLSNYEAFKAAQVPLVRTHDAAFCPTYGGQHTVDIMNIFPDFDADENDPASYDFTLTDEYMESILSVGSGVFYRLGNKIEHESKRYGALPPKDYAKWARICEHVIRHMNEGWADGHAYGIRYWEIWNEPDLHPQCWDAVNEAFYPLFDVTARHLKACFPELKIGGPAVTGVWNAAFLDGFFKYLTRDPENPAPLDFFSFHRYAFDPHAYGDDSRRARALLDSYGYTETETILNEWNYVKRWDDILPSYYTIPSLKGSAFIAGAMIEAQHSPLDHFMYYDARLSTKWNGLYDAYSLRPLKTYRAMYAFKELYRLGGEVSCTSDDRDVMAMAAVSPDGREAAILATYYRDHESIDGSGTESETVRLRLDWTGFSSAESVAESVADGVKAEYLLIDREHELEAVSEEIFFGETGAHVLTLPLYTTVLVKLTKLSGGEEA